MSYFSRISVSLIGLAALALCLATALYTVSSRFERDLERSHLAFDEMETLLQLAADTYRLFKQVRRDLLDGNAEPSVDLYVSRARFEARLDDLRDEIERELAFVDIAERAERERAELDALTELTNVIETALSEVEQALDMFQAGRDAEASVLLAQTLETRIDVEFDRLIRSAIDVENGELSRIEASALDRATQARWFAQAIAVLAVAFAVIAGFLLIRRLRRPLAALERGTQQIAEGRLDHRIALDERNDEFARVSQRFNSMAADLQGQQRALRAIQASLEQTVARRTEQLLAANETLLKQDRMRRALFVDIGHELRTPITVILGEAEVGLRSRDDRAGPYRESLDRIVGVSRQLTRLVNDIFLIARSEAGEIDMRTDLVDLAEVAAATVDEERATLAGMDVTLETAVANPVPLIHGDRMRLRQLLMILIDNAARYGGTGTRICVGTEQSDGGVTLFVEDNGPGITPADRERVFERFYRGGRSASAPSPGTGLGLPIARSIVRAHGGDIDLTTEVGAGTRVVCRFTPAAVDDCLDEVVGDEMPNDDATDAAVPRGGPLGPPALLVGG